MHYPLPFHSNAMPAAEASECANEQGKFWEMHDKIFANTESMSIENFKLWAAELGMNTDQFNDCLDNNKYADLIEANTQAGSEAYIGGTPSFVINNQLLVGAQPIAAFKAVLDAEQ